MSAKKIVITISIVFFCLLGLLAVVLYKGIKTYGEEFISMFDYGDYSYASYTPQEPAQTAEEWKARLSEMQESYEIDFNHLYAELPPESEWDGVIAALKEAQKAESEESGEYDYGYDHSESLKMFTALLTEDFSTAQKIYAKSVSGKELEKYEYEEAIATLTQLRMPLEEAKKILVLKKKPDTKSEKKKYDKEWQRLLARGEVDKALTKLKNDSKWDKIYRIGKLYEREDLVEVGIEGMRRDAENKLKSTDDYISYYELGDFLEPLNREKRYDEVIDFSERALPLVIEQDVDDSKYILPSYFYAIGKKQGGAALLEKLASLPDYQIDTKEKYLSFITNYDTPSSLIVLIAQALREAERSDDAVVLLKHAITHKGGVDALYREFVTHHSDQISFLDELMEWNPYQERPLIWKGHYLLQKGQLDSAEEVINRAIALDPSDGEQGKDTRMEVYNVLSLIHAARGNTEQATFFADVMKAIRAGEVADDYLYLGLIDEAIRRYNKALAHFEDAYCLQSRLAKTLLEEGNIEQAKVHFEKAFELMPVSFGPVESHCFGCEGIFDSQEAQEVAERVFTSVVEKSPENPRTYYLIAKLYEEQGKVWEAFPYFLKAFERDPHYYNCAKKLHTYILLKPQLSEEHPDLRQQIMDTFPYADLTDIFEERLDLKTCWKDAQNLAKTRKSPLQLPHIIPPFKVNQDAEPNNSYNIDEVKAALDGWQAHDLLRNNSFLEYGISTLNNYSDDY